MEQTVKHASEAIFYCTVSYQLASRIFASGLKDYLHEPEFLFKYLDFLFYTHDHKNMRVTFEKVLDASNSWIAYDKARKLEVEHIFLSSLSVSLSLSLTSFLTFLVNIIVLLLF